MRTILALDGGGIRGLIQAVILDQIENMAGRPIHALFDMVAGTSAGAINAGMLVQPKPAAAAEIVRLYRQQGPRIFERSSTRTLMGSGRLLLSKYDGVGFESVLAETFGAVRLKSLLCDTLIPAFDMTSYRPWFFKSWRARTDPSYDFALRDAVRASASAPSYFPAYVLDKSVFADGGVFAANPAMCALAEAARIYPGEELMLVSIGTGQADPRFSAGDWGLVRWAGPLIQILTDAVSEVDDYQVRYMLPDLRSFRVQVPLSGDMLAIDRCDRLHLDRLVELGRATVQAIQSGQRELVAALLANRPCPGPADRLGCEPA